MVFAATQPLQIGSMLMGLLGGLAIFLFGMEQMTSTLRILAGARMKAILAALTANRFTGVLAGTFVTSVIQSSSVTTVLVVGFVSAGLMSMEQSIGIIMGAEIGTTITAQITAFNITGSALAIVAVGFLIQFLSKQTVTRKYGTMILGFGLLFFGINLMSDATEPLRSYQPFMEAAHRLNNPLAGILLAAGFTAVIQSSSATTVLVIVLSRQNLISLEQAIPLILGANIGTCITALLASIGKPREAIRAAVVHVTFNVLGVGLWFGFIDQLAWIVRQLSDVPARQIAHSHTVFNVANTCVFIWLTTPLGRLVTWLVPERSESSQSAVEARHLDVILLRTPSLALDTVRMELQRLGIAALEVVRTVLTAVVQGDSEDLDRLQERAAEIDQLYETIVSYLARLSRENLSKQQSKQLHDFLLVANYFESIGDMIESNLVLAGRRRVRHGLSVSDATQQHLELVHHAVCRAVERSVRAIARNDPEAAQETIALKQEVDQLLMHAEDHLSHRLGASAPNRLVAFQLESEIMEYLK
ncbi:MAG: Na/Pi cotransporter family protein, partial [Planctomycetaceae bacterium]|nr:Na/Pi cotransporter family protein [Planctomycetaceae bacterium]